MVYCLEHLPTAAAVAYLTADTASPQLSNEKEDAVLSWLPSQPDPHRSLGYCEKEMLGQAHLDAWKQQRGQAMQMLPQQCLVARQSCIASYTLC